MTPGPSLAGLVFRLLPVLIGAATLLYTGREAFLGSQSEGWPTTVARIESAEVKRTRNSRSRRKAAIVYRYTAGGRSHTANRIRFGVESGPGGRSASELVSRFPPGSSTRVAYDPGNPARAVLLPGFDVRDNLGPILTGLLFLGVGAILLVKRR